MVRYWDSEFNYQKGRKNEFYKTRCIGAFYEIPSSLSYNELNRMFEEVISQLSNTCKYKFVKKKYKMDVINTKGYYEAKVNDRIVIDVSFTQATHSDPYSLELLIRESLNQ